MSGVDNEIGSVAIVGLAGRFPGATNAVDFWSLIRDGREGIRDLTDEELLADGVDARWIANPAYVRRAGILDGIDRFAAPFFGIPAREAEITDPQHRIFLECAWEALENSGWDPARFEGRIGLFAGCGLNAYAQNLYSDVTADVMNLLPLILANDKDHLATRVSYKLNLRGPSLTVQSACSTSLVAAHVACRALLTYECDMALAGGVSVRVPQHAGYVYQDGGVLSPNGQCRPFDADAQGTVFGSGVGVVVLRRLPEALADRDYVYAVIKGSAVNNDGGGKVGYTAPSLRGQAEVIAEALAAAGTAPATIGYVEAHGTGTALGDPIEVAALRQVYGAGAAQCAVGSVKGNVGHLDAAAGVAGLIKAALVVRHGEIPPTVNFERLNPRIELAGSPFYVNQQLRPWPAALTPRRAAVSSFGMGGTNAHVVLEQAPPVDAPAEDAAWELLPVSGRSPEGVQRASLALEAVWRTGAAPRLADAAFTLQQRRWHGWRRAVVTRPGEVSAAWTAALARAPVAAGEPAPGVVFVFPGQGAQYAGMGETLWRQEPVFAAAVDRCGAVLAPLLGCDIRDVLWGSRQEALTHTEVGQAAVFTMQYALAEVWQAWGVRPWAVVGHSLGEWVAACVAGVFALPESLRLVVERGRLMQALPAGRLLAVAADAATVQAHVRDGLEIAVLNGPAQCVVGGAAAPLRALAAELAAAGLACRFLSSTRAFHTRSMAPAAGPLTAAVAAAERSAPRVPMVSSATGTWLRADQARDPQYWGQQLVEPVRFHAALETIEAAGTRPLWLDVGPGRSLYPVLKAQVDQRSVAGGRGPGADRSEHAALLYAAARLWEHGVALRPAAATAAHRRRVPLPPLPFDRQRYWIESGGSARAAESVPAKRGPVQDWLYVPGWTRSAPLPPSHAHDRWIAFVDDAGLAEPVIESLIESGTEVVRVGRGDTFARTDRFIYAIDRGRAADVRALFDDLQTSGLWPANILYSWPGDSRPESGATVAVATEELLAVLQRLPAGALPEKLVILSAGGQDVMGSEALNPAASIPSGLCPVIAQEFPGVLCRNIDVEHLSHAGELRDLVAADVAGRDEPLVAYRGRARWLPTYTRIPSLPAAPSRLRQHGAYVIIGGLGSVGSSLARYIARTSGARLALVGRHASHPDERQQQFLSELAAAGTDVLPISADVADESALTAAIATAKAHFGGIDGVIHAAGLSATEAICPLRDATASDCVRQFEAKIAGTVALRRAMDANGVERCVVSSSLAAILGGLGLGLYAAANRFQDTFVRRESRSGRASWLTINWDGWNFGGQSTGALAGAMRDFSITPAEGEELFGSALEHAEAVQLVVSTGDIAARQARWQQRATPEPDVTTGSHTRDPRPDISTPYRVPDTESERRIVELMERTLGLERIGVDDSFFDLGGDSLVAARFMSALRQVFGDRLPPLQALFEAASAARMARLLDDNGSGGAPTAEPVVDLAQDIQLPSDFPLTIPGALSSRPPQRVLLTGATGFLGAFLLQQLLEQTSAEVCCIVRGRSPEHARERIGSALRDWTSSPPACFSRIVPIPGDLAQPSFGLPAAVYDDLAESVDAIYHSGALVNFVLPYSRLYPSNVSGTREVLRLAACRRPKPVHYVSTIDVFYSVGAARAGAVTEAADIRTFGAPYGGYSESKWVAEQIVSMAGHRGLPIAIYRSGFASAHSESGIGNTQDFLSRVIKGCLLLGAAPDLGLVIDMTPVDFISRAIVHISGRATCIGKAFHLLNPTSWNVRDLARWLQSSGYELDLLPYDAWRALAFRVAAESEDHPLNALLSVFPEELPLDLMRMPEFGRQNVVEGLAGTNISCPEVNASLLGRYLTAYQDSGFLRCPDLAGR